MTPRLDYQYYGPRRREPLVIDLPSALFGFGVCVLCFLIAFATSHDPDLSRDE